MFIDWNTNKHAQLSGELLCFKQKILGEHIFWK